MNQNEADIKRLDSDERYYKNLVDNSSGLSGKNRTNYKKYLKQTENAKQLAILKERNIRS